MLNSGEPVNTGRVVSRPKSGRVATCRGRRLIALGLIALLQSNASAGDEARYSEHELKAAFLLRLPAFVKWPSAAQTSPVTRICIVGPDPFGKTLDDLAKAYGDGSRKILARLEASEDASSCSLVFLGAMERASRVSLLQSMAGRAILTVGEADDFTKTGGMVRFVAKGDRVGFEINLTAVQRGHLALSSQLLTISSVVHHALPWERDQ